MKEQSRFVGDRRFIRLNTAYSTILVASLSALGLSNIVLSHVYSPAIKMAVDGAIIFLSMFLIFRRLHVVVSRLEVLYAFILVGMSLLVVYVSPAPLHFVLIEVRPLLLLALALIASTALKNRRAVKLGDRPSLMIFLSFLLILLAYVILILNGADRRSLFIFREHNFELMSLIIVSIYFFDRSLSSSYFLLIIAFVTIALSQSISVMAAFLVGCLFLAPSRKLQFVGLIVGLGLFIGVVSLRFSVSGSLNLSEIDRFVYAGLFISDWTEKTNMEMFWSFSGVQPVTATTCSTLSWFEAGKDSGGCYPVVYHMIWLRNLEVYGILPTLLVLFAFFRLLKNCFGAQKAKVYAVFFSVILSGFSVSGYANGFVFLTLLMIGLATTTRNRKLLF